MARTNAKDYEYTPLMLDGLQLAMANVADFLRSTMEWTERAHTALANTIAMMGRSVETLLAQVRAA